MAYRICLFAAMIFLKCIDSHAQNRYRAEVFGSLGDAQTINLGPSKAELNFGGGVGIRPFSVERPFALRMLGGEFEANFTRNTSLLSNPTQGYFTGNLVLHFFSNSTRVEPYLLVGAGGFHQGNETRRAADAGAGAKIFITPHISLRPEIRGFITKYSEGDFLRFSVGLGYHW